MDKELEKSLQACEDNESVYGYGLNTNGETIIVKSNCMMA